MKLNRRSYWEKKHCNEGILDAVRKAGETTYTWIILLNVTKPRPALYTLREYKIQTWQKQLCITDIGDLYLI
jgi:hypothetical protein